MMKKFLTILGVILLLAAVALGIAAVTQPDNKPASKKPKPPEPEPEEEEIIDTAHEEVKEETTPVL